MEQREWLNEQIRKAETQVRELYAVLDTEKKQNGKGTLKYTTIAREARQTSNRLKYLREKLAQVK